MPTSEPLKLYLKALESYNQGNNNGKGWRAFLKNKPGSGYAIDNPGCGSVSMEATGEHPQVKVIQLIFSRQSFSTDSQTCLSPYLHGGLHLVKSCGKFGCRVANNLSLCTC
ncbi:unnamed protein product [marine sediment metagenome]|uniref:Uncharacterized protein n=1 Tax=marine sediment metagenome TaxID=412755 RepID=X1RUI8_9ZZZZ